MATKPRSISADIIDAVATGTKKWTRQKKSEERHPGMRRYRVSRMTRQSRTTQKDAAWQVMEEAYMAASGNGRLPAKARQIFYQARPKIMALTENKELHYGYFSQTLLPDYVEERGGGWKVVYDARGHFEEPHTSRCIGCGTIEVNNYLRAMKGPSVDAAKFTDTRVDVIGPNGGFSAILYVEKEGFDSLFKAVDLANRYDLMIVSNKGVSVTAARQLIDTICGKLPLFVLHDFDVAGFMIKATLQRDTRRHQHFGSFEMVDLGLRLDDIAELASEPAARSNTREDILSRQLRRNGASEAEAAILLNERVELNAMASDALVEMIERKLQAYGLKKVVPDDDRLLGEVYQAFHRSQQLRKEFKKLDEGFKETKVEVPKDLKEQVRAILAKHADLRWDDAVQVVLDGNQLDHVRAEKQEAKKRSGDFTDADEEGDE
jgi:hypothetical protein